MSKTVSRYISVDLYKAARMDVVRLEIDAMLAVMPEADVIRIELFTIEARDD